MHAIPENARLKAVASPIPAVHSHAPGDCTPPVYMPPTSVMDRYEAQSAAHDVLMLGLTTGNKPLTHAARALYYDLEDGRELSPVDADTLYACIAFAATLTPPLQALPVLLRQEVQASEPHPGGSPCATTIANTSSRGQSAAHAATAPARNNTNLKNTRLWSQTSKTHRPAGPRSSTWGVS